jgi:hypothetical protein
MTPDKKESTCQRRGPMAKWSMLPQKIIVEQMEGSGELLKFVMNSKIKVKLRQLLKFCFQLR